MIPVRLSKDAADFVRREAEYLRQRNLAAARKFSLTMRNARKPLQSFPQAGNHMHGLRLKDTLTLVAGDYLLDYAFDGETVSIVTIRHGRMQFLIPDVEIDESDDG